MKVGRNENQIQKWNTKSAGKLVTPNAKVEKISEHYFLLLLFKYMLVRLGKFKKSYVWKAERKRTFEINPKIVIIKTICQWLYINEETATDKLLVAIFCDDATFRADVSYMKFRIFIKK
jgi:hypothetical protein